ncbi:unnamed protein product [Caenorhabditis auriculariae]|uniref:Uncharacterized protein n=1 Tax=Caenorhabditis auriculariae TaxID=2777116 RepID=A0A8S1H6P3_9PELO|nr:unnamed protein product [Caenorhabditis auriculariae]
MPRLLDAYNDFANSTIQKPLKLSPLLSHGPVFQSRQSRSNPKFYPIYDRYKQENWRKKNFTPEPQETFIEKDVIEDFKSAYYKCKARKQQNAVEPFYYDSNVFFMWDIWLRNHFYMGDIWWKNHFYYEQTGRQLTPPTLLAICPPTSEILSSLPQNKSELRSKTCP